MSLLNIFNIAGSAMKAQAQKMNIISSNLANSESVVYKNGKFFPYIAKKIIFALDAMPYSNIGGVKVSNVINDNSPMKMIYDPSNPMSNSTGYVLTSNVNPITETINNIAAARSYQANIEVIKTAKSMIMKTLTLSE